MPRSRYRARSAEPGGAVAVLSTATRCVRMPVAASVITLEPLAGQAERTDAATGLDRAWCTVVWNDPVNLMSYVAWVFRSYFGFDRAEAERRMMQVHTDGRATVAVGGREEMERHVEAMHGYGLMATLERQSA